jgi:hypothetical protein
VLFRSVGRAEVVEHGLWDDEVKVSGAVPILFGFQYSLFKDVATSAFQPYVSAAAGPYIISQVHVIDDTWSFSDEVKVKSRVQPGVSAAMGVYFLFAKWCALNGEMRYHLVNFDPKHDTSGIELGLGMAFFWRR